MWQQIINPFTPIGAIMQQSILAPKVPSFNIYKKAKTQVIFFFLIFN